MALNPIIPMDCPDPDVIRVGDIYYMASTTMHFFPGCAILRSFDLANWEIIGHVFDSLDETPGEKMERDATIYAKGMWAPSLRYHDGYFYIAFYSASSKKTYLFTSTNIEGEWEKKEIEGSFYDCSLLFDEDKVYIVYGHKDIFISELKSDLSGLKTGGLHRKIISENEDVIVPYEGSHAYKIGNRYYIFLIHWPKAGKRVECCFVSDSIEGEFKGGVVLDDDRNYFGQGVAQGGIVESLSGKWYSVLFQDSGAVGRMPILVPIAFDENGFPVFGVNGKVPEKYEITGSRPYYSYEPLYTSDFFDNNIQTDDEKHPALKKQWEWNHVSDSDLWEKAGDRAIKMRTGRIATNLPHAANTLTQRTMWPRCDAEVSIDGKDMQNGDVAGLCVLQGNYGYLALAKEAGVYYLIKVTKTVPENYRNGSSDYLPGKEELRIRLNDSKVTVRLTADFDKMEDSMNFYYIKNDRFTKVGEPHKLVFKLDHFTGARFGIFMYSTQRLGGTAVFENFGYKYYGVD